jgi:magnesium transporter
VNETAPPPPLIPEELNPTAVQRAVKEGRNAELIESLRKLAPIPRADLFIRLRPPEQKAILADTPPALAAAILADCDLGSLRATLADLDFETIRAALPLVPAEHLADIALQLPEERREKMLGLLAPELASTVRDLLRFDPHTAGGMMSPRAIRVPEVFSAARALETIRGDRHGGGASYIYVVDRAGKLIGTLPLRRLLMAEPRQPIEPLVHRGAVKVRASAPRDEIVGLFNEHHYVSLPVVDDQDRLLGIVTFDDVMAAMRADEERIVEGITGADPREALGTVVGAAGGRLPWVTVTILGGLGCAVVAGLFQATLKEAIILGIFIPIVLALGESVGAQTTSVVLSSLISGDVKGAQVGRFLLKELAIGLVVGLYAAAAVGLVSYFWHGNAWTGACIGGAIALSVAWAALLGVAIPGAMVRFRVNPAIASGPLVLALADLSTLFIYFGLAALLIDRIR